jgi:hypothetical protein
MMNVYIAPEQLTRVSHVSEIQARPFYRLENIQMETESQKKRQFGMWAANSRLDIVVQGVLFNFWEQRCPLATLVCCEEYSSSFTLVSISMIWLFCLLVHNLYI